MEVGFINNRPKQAENTCGWRHTRGYYPFQDLRLQFKLIRLILKTISLTLYNFPQTPMKHFGFLTIQKKLFTNID